jgi:hypothetical protein
MFSQGSVGGGDAAVAAAGLLQRADQSGSLGRYSNALCVRMVACVDDTADEATNSVLRSGCRNGSRVHRSQSKITQGSPSE